MTTVVATAALLSLLWGTGAVQAQALNSPVGSPPSAGASKEGLGSASSAVPAVGNGPGYHSPQSPFKPLEEREGVVSWKRLSAVKTRNQKGRLVPDFPPDVQALNAQKVKVQGFMMPLDASEKQTHFLLSSVPPTCGFCVPAGPEGLIEIRTTSAVRYTLEPVVVEGALAVLSSDPYGLYYRIEKGQAVKLD